MKELVQITPTKAREVGNVLKAAKIPYKYGPFDYLTVEMPPEVVPQVRALPNVVNVIPERRVEIRQIVIPIEKKLSEFSKLFWSNPLTGPTFAFKYSLEADMGKVRVPTSVSRKMIGADVADAENITGKGVKVAVLDTGTNALGVQGPYLGGRSSVEGQPVQADENGHGTHCQTTISGRPFQSIHGLLKGVAIDAEVAAFKVLGYGIGAGTNISVLRGLMDAFSWGASIISMSLGSPYSEEPVEELPECRAIKMLTEQGVIIVVAAGNDGDQPNTIGVPANSPDALSVGAVDIEGNLAYFSSRGPTAQGLIKPDCVAPGVNILSTSAGLIATMQFMDGPPLLAAISGTCLTKEAEVYTPNGPVSIADMAEPREVYCFNGKLVRDNSVAFIPHGKQEVFELITRDGKAIQCTASHRFLRKQSDFRSIDGLIWTPLADLKIDDNILVIHSLPDNPEPQINEYVDARMAHFLGNFLGDGWISHSSRTNRVNVPTSDTEFIREFSDLFGHELTPTSYGWAYMDTKKLVLALCLLGFFKKHPEAEIPQWIYHLSREKQESFVTGLLDADGWGSKRDKGKRIELASGKLIRNLKHLCDSMGWKTGLVKERQRLSQPPHSKEPKLWRSWSLFIKPYHIPGPRVTLDTHLKLAQVKSIKRVGEKEVFDITTSSHNFVANGMVVHNSMATPHVAGLLALALQYARMKGKTLTTEKIKEALELYGSPKNNDVGNGLLTYPMLKSYIDGL